MHAQLEFSLLPFFVPAVLVNGQSYEFQFVINNQNNEPAQDVSFSLNMGPEFSLISISQTLTPPDSLVLNYTNGLLTGYGGTLMEQSEPTDSIVFITATFQFNCPPMGTDLATITGNARAYVSEALQTAPATLNLQVVPSTLAIGAVVPQPSTMCGTSTTGSIVVNFSGGVSTPQYTVTATNVVTGVSFSAMGSSSPLTITDVPVGQSYSVSVTDGVGCTATAPGVTQIPTATNPLLLGEITAGSVSCTAPQATFDPSLATNGTLTVAFQGAPSTMYNAVAWGVTVNSSPETTASTTTDGAGFGSAMIMSLHSR